MNNMSYLEMKSNPSHCELAMQAAQRMRRVKHKQRNSRIICHHLVQMLQDPAAVSSADTSALDARQIALGF